MNDLQELLDHYFSLGVAEGKEGRDHDTPDGEAQATRDLIDQKIMRLRRESAEARKAAFIEAAGIATATGTDAENDWPGETWIADRIATALRSKAEETGR